MKKIISLSSFSFIILALMIGLISLSNVNAQNSGSLITTVNAGFSFAKDLELGDTDPDVRELQKVLNSDVDTLVASTGIGSQGQESTYFGNLTKLAVIKFQNKYASTVLTPIGMTAGNGYVGLRTRTKLNQLIGVATTLPSAGQPQNQAGSGSSAPATNTNSGQTQMSTCQFVDLLINIGAIAPNLANQARTAVSCSTTSTATGQTPTVDIKINGQNGPISLNSPQNVTISWTSSNVTSCVSQTAKPTSGSDTVYINASGNIGISCTGPYGTVTDSVSINLANSNNGALQVSCYADPDDIDTGDSLIWRAEAEGGTGSYSYSWSGAVTGSSANVSKTYTVAGAKTATVHVSSGSLSATASCSANVGQGNANTASALQVSCSASPTSVNLGEPITWIAAPSGGNGTFTYSWLGAELSGASQTLARTYTTAGAKSAVVMVSSGNLTASNTCSANVNSAGSAWSGFDTTATTTAPVIPLQASCLASPSSVTLNNAVTWIASPTGGSGAYTYSWSGTEALSGNSNYITKNYSFVGNKQASVSITSGSVTVTANCSASVTQDNTSGVSTGNSFASGSNVEQAPAETSISPSDASVAASVMAGSSGTLNSLGSLTGMDPSTILNQLMSGSFNDSSAMSGLSGQNLNSAMSQVSSIRSLISSFRNGGSALVFGGRVVIAGVCDTNPAPVIYPPPTYIRNVTETPYFTIVPDAGGMTVGATSMVGYLLGATQAPGTVVLGNYTPGGMQCTDSTGIPTPGVPFIGYVAGFLGGSAGSGLTGTASGSIGGSSQFSGLGSYGGGYQQQPVSYTGGTTGTWGGANNGTGGSFIMTNGTTCGSPNNYCNTGNNTYVGAVYHSNSTGTGGYIQTSPTNGTNWVAPQSDPNYTNGVANQDTWTTPQSDPNYTNGVYNGSDWFTPEPDPNYTNGVYNGN